MRKFALCLAVLSMLLLVTGTTMAAVFGDGGASLQGTLDGITIAPNPGISSVNVLTDDLPDMIDSYWGITGTGGSVSTLVIELASFASTNTFGVFDATNPMTKAQLFDGAATTGSQVTLSITSLGDVYINHVDTGIDFGGTYFGFYMDSRLGHPGWTGGLWYSDTSLNVDGMDHMYAYQGKNIDTVQISPWGPGLWTDSEFVIAFEDLHQMHWGNQNGINDGYPEWSDVEPDFSDMVVMVESVQPIPEPCTLLLLGLGLVGVAGIGRKKFNI
jgi:hypothetical protein